ncbi:hypothetical protein NDU88_006459 [Pleurodeles waltl]|uniref:Uncharacterized protein n=1 Tax=Pleurodeles waltl TaxID=8319 RepID=A0AAV7MCA2_PLEWA|nr:hypothetical protein NDU88_006459 [Pleurodeles waltl]
MNAVTAQGPEHRSIGTCQAPLDPGTRGGGKDCQGGRCRRLERETTKDLHNGIEGATCRPGQEIASRVKELKREVVELEQRVDTVECNHRQELLTL